MRRGKIKTLLLGLFAITLTIITTVVFGLSNKVKAAVTVKVSYEVYDYDEYAEYLKALSFDTNWQADSGAAGSVPAAKREDAWNAALTGSMASKNVYANADSTVSAATYWANFFGKPAPLSFADATTEANNFISSSPYFVYDPDWGMDIFDGSSLTAKDEVNANQKIAILVKLDTQGGSILNTGIPLDLDGITSVAKVSGSYASNTVYNSGIDGLATDDTKIYSIGIDDAFNSSLINASSPYPMVGGTKLNGMNTLPVSGSDISVGVIATKLANTISGSITIGYKEDYDYLIGKETDGSTNYTYTQTPLTLTAIGSSSNVAQIDHVKVGGNSYSVSATTVDTNDTFVVGDQNSSTTGATVEVNTKQGGTINAAKYIIKSATDTTPITAASFAAASNASISGKNIVVSPAANTWNQGDSIWIQVDILASDGTTHAFTSGTSHGYYYIQVPKEKSQVVDLTNITVATSAGGSAIQLYSALTPTLTTTTFVAGTTQYYVRVPNATTNVYIKPFWTDTTISKVEVEGNTIAASGNEQGVLVTVTASATSYQKVVVKVTAQDTTKTRDYEIYIDKLSDSVDEATTNAVGVKGSSASTTFNATKSGTTYSYKLAYGTNSFQVALTVKEVGKQKLEYCTDWDGTTGSWVAATSGALQSSISFASGNGADTKYAYFKITSEDDSASQVYTCKIERDGGSQKTGLSATGIQLSYDGTGAESIAATVTTANNGHGGKEYTLTKTGVKYAVSGFDIKVSGEEPGKQKITYSTDGGTTWTPLSDNAWTNTTGSFKFHTGTTDYTPKTKTVIVRITAEDQTFYSDYTIQVSRDKASEDATLSAFELYTVDGSTQTLVSGANLAAFTTVGTNEVLDLTAAASQFAYAIDKLKVKATYQATSKAQAANDNSPQEAYNLTSTVLSGDFTFGGTAADPMDITITVTAENANYTKTYVVKTVRKAAEDDTNIYLTITAPTGEVFNVAETDLVKTGVGTSSETWTYTLSSSLPFVDGGVYNNEIDIEVGTVSNTSKTKIYYSGTDKTGVNDTYDIDKTSPYTYAYDTTTPKTFNFVVQTEKNAHTSTTVGYKLKVLVLRDAPNDDKTIKDDGAGNPDVKVYGSLDSQQLALISSSTPTHFKYELVKSTGGANYTLSLQANNSKTKIYTNTTSVTPSVNVYDPTYYASFGTPYNASAQYVGDVMLYVYLIAESGSYQLYLIDVKYADERQEGHVITNMVVTEVDGTALTTPLVFSAATATEEKTSSFVKTLNNLTVPYSIKKLKVTVTFDATTSDKAKFTVNGGTTKYTSTAEISLGQGPNQIDIQGESEKGTLGCVYRFNVQRDAAELGRSIIDLSVNSKVLISSDPSVTAPFTSTDNYLNVAVVRNAPSVTITFALSTLASYTITASGDGQTFTGASGTQSTSASNSYIGLTGLTPGKKYTVTISVLSEQNVADSVNIPNSYTLLVYTAEEKYDVQNIKLYKEVAKTNLMYDTSNNPFTFVSGTSTYPSFTVAYKNNTNAYADVVLKNDSRNAHITRNNGTDLLPLSDTTPNLYEIYVESEYSYLASLDGIAVNNQNETYSITITREQGDTNNKLSNLEVKYVVTNNALPYDGPKSFNANDFSYKVSSAPYNTGTMQGTYQIVPTAASAKATVQIIGSDDDANNSDLVTLTVATDGSGNPVHNRATVKVKVTPEVGTPVEYQVTISTGKVDTSKDNTVKSIAIYADNDSTTNLLTPFNVSNYTPSISVRATVNSVNIVVDANDRNSSLTINGDPVNWNAQKNVPLAVKPGTNTIEVVSKAEDSSVADIKYTITVESLGPDTDKSLGTYRVDLYDTTTSASTVAQSENPTGQNETIYVSNKIDKAKVIAIANSQYATLTPNIGTNTRTYEKEIIPLAVGPNMFSFTINNEDNQPVAYTLTIYRDDIVTIDALELKKPGDATNLVDITDPTTYNQTFAFSQEKLDLAFVIGANPDNVTVTAKQGIQTLSLTQDTSDPKLFTVGQLNLSVGNNKISITIKGKKDTKTYEFNLSRSNGSGSNYILTYTQENGTAYTANNKNIVIGTETVTVIDDSKPIVYVLDRTYAGQVFNPTLTVSDTAKEIGGSKYQISPNSLALNVGPNNFSIKVTAETGGERDYNVTVYVADTSKDILSIKLLDSNGNVLEDVDGKTLEYSDSTYLYPLKYAYSVNAAELLVETKSGYAKVLVNNAAIGAVSSTDPTHFSTSLNIANSKVDTTTGAIEFKIQAQSEYVNYNSSAKSNSDYVSATYVISIEKENPNTNTNLKTLTVVAGTKTFEIYKDGAQNTSDANITFSGNDITLGNAGTTVTGFSITAVPEKLPTMTSLAGVTYNPSTKTATGSVTIPVDSSSQSHTITVYSEDGTLSTDYNIILFRGAPIDPDEDFTITRIEVFDNNGNYYINKDNFQQSQNTYTFNTSAIPAIPYSSNGVKNTVYTLVAYVSPGSRAKVSIDGSFVDSKTQQVTISWPADGSNYTKTHSIFAQSQKGVSGDPYTINVVGLAAGSDATLSDIIIDNVSVETPFDKQKDRYSTSDYRNEEEDLYIVAKPTDPNATISITTVAADGTSKTISGAEGTVDLKVGKNTITITVTAENGKTTKPYVVTAFREYETPYLEDLEVVGETLVNSSYNEKLEFAEETLHYYVKLLYGTKTFTFNAILKSDNANFKVICDGTTIVNGDGTTRTFTANTKEGTNDYTILVRDPISTKSTKYTLTVKLNDSSTATTNISVVQTSGSLPKVVTTVSIDPKDPTKLIEVVDPETYDLESLPGVELVDEKGVAKTFKPLTGFTTDYSNGNTTQEYGPYVVANRVRSIDDSVLLLTPEKAKDAFGDGEKIEIITGDKLAIGQNKCVIQVTSEDGNNVRTIVLDVVRLDNEFNMSIDEIPAFENDYAADDVKDVYTVDADVTDLTFSVTNKDSKDTEQPKVNIISGTPLKAGLNTVKVLVTPTDGTPSFEQVITVERKPYNIEVSSPQLTTFKEDYSKDTFKDNYEVTSATTKVEFTATNKDFADAEKQPTLKISNGGKLDVGENTVTLTISTNDGFTVEKTIKVTRAPMAFEVDKMAYDYACEKNGTKEGYYYTINLVDKTADAIEDYKKYIKFDSATNDLDIEILSGDITSTTSEVILRVSTKDNVESEIVHLQLESKNIGAPGSMFDIIFWIILGISIVLLIIILICVNRDKYGSVSKNRKRA